MKLTKETLESIIQEELENLMEETPESNSEPGGWFNSWDKDPHNIPSWRDPVARERHRKKHARRRARIAQLKAEPGEKIYNPARRFSSRFKPGAEKLATWLAGSEERGKNVHVGGPHVPEPNEPKLDLMGRAPGEPGYGKYPKKPKKPKKRQDENN